MKKSWWRSLQVKIVVWSFVPTVIILSAVAWFIFFSYQKVLGDQAIKQDREIIQEKGAQAVIAVNNMVAPVVLPIFIEIDILHQGTLEERAEKILNQAQGLEIFDGGIYFLDQQGKIFKTRPEDPELIGLDWSETPDFRYLQVHNNATVPTDLRTIVSSGKKVICTAMAMLGQHSETVGALYLCFNIYPAIKNPFYQTINDQNLGLNVYVLDGHQNIVYSPDLSEIGQNVSGEAYIQQLLKDENQSGRFRIGNEDVLASFDYIFSYPDYEGWVIVKEQSWAEIMEPSLPYRQLLLVLLALGVIVPVLVTAYGVRRIIDPIRKLIWAAEQVTAGQFKQRIDVKTGDEIETLADQFNLMSQKLDDSYSLLENKVVDRTRELAIMNSIISVASQSLDIQEILEDVLDQIVQQLGFEAGAAFRFEVNAPKVVLVTQQGFEPTVVISIVESIAITGQGEPVIYPNEVIVCGIDDCQDEKLRDLLFQSRFQQLVYVPLTTKGRELGFLLLGGHELGQPTSEELSLFGSIGKQVGVAVENARLYEQAEQAAVLAERNRLARELHDAVTQTLFSASLIADVIPRIWERDPEEGKQNLEELRQLARGALAEMRTLLLEMRPESIERSDIKSLLTQLTDAFVGRVRIPLKLQMQGDCGMTREVKVVFYRVAQEALNNIAKHSGAQRVDLHLECQPGQVSLLIKDDGLGFETDSISPDHMGIAIMRERASSIGACLRIESQLGLGTTVELNWRSVRKDGTNENFSDDPGHVSG